MCVCEDPATRVAQKLSAIRFKPSSDRQEEKQKKIRSTKPHEPARNIVSVFSCVWWTAFLFASLLVSPLVLGALFFRYSQKRSRRV
jgi:hypothetical protein